jgi:hypothetical protein
VTFVIDEPIGRSSSAPFVASVPSRARRASRPPQKNTREWFIRFDSIRFDAAHGDAHRDGARDFRASPRAMDARTTRVRTRDDDGDDDDDDATHRAR